jgi:hypothetical protein rflaF_12469
MNEFTIVAGAVGVGKSSFIGALASFKNSLGEIIADDDKTAVRRIQSCMDDGVDFTLESTLSGENTLAVIKTAVEKGHRITLYYIAVNSAEESLRRISNRVRKGGRSVSAEEVRRSYLHRFEVLPLILPYCDSARFYDNENGFRYVAEYRNGEIVHADNRYPDWLKELNEKLVLAWDSDFTKVTEAEREQIKHAEESGFVRAEDIDWGNLEKYNG